MSSNDGPSDILDHQRLSSNPDALLAPPSNLQLKPATLQALAGALHLASSAASPIYLQTQPNPEHASSHIPPIRETPLLSSANKYKNQKKLPQDKSSQNNKKTTSQWDHDHNGHGKTSMYLLIDWLTEEGNFARFKDSKSTKKGVSEEIEKFLIQNGVTWRDPNAIQKKIERLESNRRKADEWRNQTGVGVWETANERKAQENWDDNHPDWLDVQKLANAPILKLCKYYFELEPIFQPRHGNTRLAAAHSLESHMIDIPVSDRPQESNSRSQRDDWEHSLHSNLAYYDDNGNPAGVDVTEEPVSPALESRPPMPSGSVRHASSHSIAPTPSHKRLLSRNSSSGDQFCPPKRSRTSGSASSIRDLFQESNFGSSSRSSTDAGRLVKDTDNQEMKLAETVTEQDRKIDRLATFAETLAVSMFPRPNPHLLLSSEQAQHKASVEIELGDMQLESERKKLAEHDFELAARRERHALEMRRMQAEFDHQQVSRNAQLICMLMKENSLSLDEVTVAAQRASAMINPSANI